MKKILITEAQLRMLENDGWSYSPEKIDEFVISAEKDLTEARRILTGAHNAITVISIGDMMDEIGRYESFVTDIENIKDIMRSYMENTTILSICTISWTYQIT